MIPFNERAFMSWSEDGTHRYWSRKTGELLATAMTTDSGGWAVTTPDGRIDSSQGFDGFHFVVGRREVVDLDQLRDRFYEPNLLAKVLGESDEPWRNIDGLDEVKLWPDVDVVGPEAGGTEFAIELTNRGGGIGEVRVRLNGVEVIGDARTARGNRVDEDARTANNLTTQQIGWFLIVSLTP
ncbi:hypothetical protein H8E07_20295, partial [bacterium]|nr:hypothetical protein [bacterium]